MQCTPYLLTNLPPLVVASVASAVLCKFPTTFKELCAVNVSRKNVVSSKYATSEGIAITSPLHPPVLELFNYAGDVLGGMLGVPTK